MKKTLLLLWGFVVATVFLVSCNEDDVDDVIACRITVSTTHGGNVYIDNYSGTSVVVDAESELTVVAVPDEGYTFLGWFVGEENTLLSSSAIYAFAVNGNCDLIARFQKLSTVSISCSSGGNACFKNSIETSMNLLSGTEVTVVAKSYNGFSFLGWFVDYNIVSQDAEYTFVVDGDVNIVAKFRKPADVVDLGLSVKWASCNVGANFPEEYGGYYAWGETVEKYDYSWNSYEWCGDDGKIMKRYCTDILFGDVDDKRTLDSGDDVAHVEWGAKWRMPTREELDELCYNCSWEWTNINGINGYKVKGANANSIFLPVAGYRYGSAFNNRGVSGNYWSRSLDEECNSNAYYLVFSETAYGWGSFNDRCGGLNVRAVCE